VASDGDCFYNDMVKTTPPVGPAPTRLRDEAPRDLDPARARVLRAVREAGRGDTATVAGLAADLGGHPNTVRHHLGALVTDGLVTSQMGSPRPPGGPGRPAVHYRVTAAGEAALGSGAEMVEEYVALAGAFADRLAAHGGDPGADALTVGRAWGTALAARGGAAGIPPASRVVGLLERLGFSPAPEVDAPGALLLRTCPLLDAARRHPEVVCQVHRGLVEGVLASDGVDEEVRLRAFDRPGACVLELPQ
jgi:predicted ArsR family transcriptional regulator